MASETHPAILVCGEALIDLVPARCGGEVGFVARGGGSPYNVAVGLARLGVGVGFLGRVSTDRFGRLLRERLAENGVDLAHLLAGPEPTTLAVVHLAEANEPDFAFYDAGTADRLIATGDLPGSLPESVGALHFGSISLVREPGATSFEALLLREAGRRLISLDPNVRPSLIPDRDAYLGRLYGWIAAADLVKVSGADLAWLYPGRPLEAVADDWLALGPRLVVVTRGERGAIARGAGGAAAVEGRLVEVSDTVGAGDAFTAGLLAWLERTGRLDQGSLARLDDRAIGEALFEANAVAAMTCTRAGAEPPTRAELERDRPGPGAAGHPSSRA